MIVTFERDIKNELKNLDKNITSTLQDGFTKRKDKTKVLTKVLSQIGDILYITSLKHDEWHNNNHNEKKFTFFPGYVDNNSERIFNIGYLNSNITNELMLINKEKYDILSEDEKEKYEKFNLDFWHNNSLTSSFTSTHHNKNNYENISLLSLAYHFLFLGKTSKQDEDDTFKDHVFSPEVGGTHQWASQISDEIAINDSLDPLTLLAFYDNKKEARDNQLKYKSWINIPFDLKQDGTKEEIQKEILEWCENVVNKLDFPSNTNDSKKKKEKWPFNPNDEKLEDNIYNERNLKHLLIYRAYIVAFWMQLVLRPNDIIETEDGRISSFKSTSNRNIIEAWFDFYTFLKENRPLSSLNEKYYDYRVKRIKQLKTIISKKSLRKKILAYNYKYWYTIPFKHRLDFSDNETRRETGSAMILTNYLLDDEYYRFIIPWLNQVFNAMREFDTAYQAKIETSNSYKRVLIDRGMPEDQVKEIENDAIIKVEN